MEKQGQQPGEHTDGVGSLPGAKDEQGVAVLPQERATKTTEMVRPEHHEEPGDIPGEMKKSTGTSDVGVGGATDPVEQNTQSRVRNNFVCDHLKLVDPRGAHNGVNFGHRAIRRVGMRYRLD